MDVSSGHWIWDRDRPLHHGGAMRSKSKDDDDEDDAFPRGPNRTPKQCRMCSAEERDNEEDEDEDDDFFTSTGGMSWYLSSSTDSSPEDTSRPCKTFSVVPARFDMKGNKGLI